MRLCNESKPVLVNKPVVSHVREARESSKDGRLQSSTELNSTLSLVSHPAPLGYYDAKRKQGGILRSSHQHHDDAHEANAHVCEGGLRFTLVWQQSAAGTAYPAHVQDGRRKALAFSARYDRIVSYPAVSVSVSVMQRARIASTSCTHVEPKKHKTRAFPLLTD